MQSDPGELLDPQARWLQGVFLVTTMSHPLQSSGPGVMLGSQPGNILRGCVGFYKSHLFTAQFSHL